MLIGGSTKWYNMALWYKMLITGRVQDMLTAKWYNTIVVLITGKMQDTLIGPFEFAECGMWTGTMLDGVATVC